MTTPAVQNSPQWSFIPNTTSDRRLGFLDVFQLLAEVAALAMILYLALRAKRKYFPTEVGQTNRILDKPVEGILRFNAGDSLTRVEFVYRNRTFQKKDVGASGVQEIYLPNLPYNRQITVKFYQGVKLIRTKGFHANQTLGLYEFVGDEVKRQPLQEINPSHIVEMNSSLREVVYYSDKTKMV